uniref:Pyridoxal 5'-Phosphate dependent protein n=1 Tax=Spironucleus salmonicida TaxID=348837 RepID=V6LJB8_9EUKA|eukprot:EST44665.1 Pyridoxal 5'-Phosphate dependent protein [Spironucleus salmonicida]
MYLKDGQLTVSQLKGHDVLTLYKDITFTTLRTLSRTMIPELEVHLCRLVSGKLTRPMACKQIMAAANVFLQNFPADIRIYCMSVGNHLDFFAESLPAAKLSSNFILMEAARADPQIKSVNWCVKRQSLEQFITSDIDEVLMHQDGFVTEGLSSNCFIILGNTIQTAGDQDVLGGNVRNSVLSICQELGIDLKRMKFTIQDIQAADCVFITSTSRGLLHANKYTLDMKLSNTHTVTYLTASCQLTTIYGIQVYLNNGGVSSFICDLFFSN